MCPAPIASAARPGTSCVPTQRTRPETQAYSAYTSLLEDSPLKVHLRPYKPVCIGEHGGCGRDVIQGVCDGARSLWTNGGKGEARQERRGRGRRRRNVWRRRNLARGRRDEQVSVRESPPFRQRGLLLVLPVSQEATSYGQRRSRSRRTRKSVERAEEAGYDSTVHGHRHPGQYRGPKQRSGMDMRQRPTGAPSRTRSARWRSHSPPDLETPRTALLSYPSSSLQTPTKDQDQPDPLTKTGTLQTQPRTRIQANAGTRRSTRELVHAYLVC